MKKRTMEKEHQAEERRKKVLMEIAGTVVVLTVIVSIGLSHLGTDKGLSFLRRRFRAMCSIRPG